MKKNKNGFFMAEVVVIIAVVAVILLNVYKQFSAVYYRYVETENYNTENAINALANIQKYYESIGFIDTSALEENVYIDLTNDSKYESEFYSKIKSEFDVDFIYLMNLEKLNDLSGFNFLFRRYLSTIKNKSNYAIVISVRGGEFTSIVLEEYKEITLVGNKDDEYAVYLSVGTEFTDPGYVNWDGDEPITSWENDKEIDINTSGTYYLHYNFNGQIIRRKIVVGDFKSEFDYTGGEQTFTADISGYYKLEVWGAQGGGLSTLKQGGYGGYSTGTVYLNKGETLYVNVGGMGVSGTTLTATKSLGGYNGGGYGVGTTSKYNSGGGGATHIAKTTGILSSLSAYAGNNTSPILIVAGGGGAGFNHNSTKYSTEGGSGGGISGNGPTPGTQTSGGGTFGQGQDSSGGSGGGGGYYGGANCNDSVICSGGSGYIGNTLLSEKSMYCYKCLESTGTDTKTISTTNVSDTAVSNYAKSGNGYASITFVGKSIYSDVKYKDKDFDYTGGEQTFTAEYTGYYKLEVWGAQGGGLSTLKQGGYGGYSTGTVYLNKGETLYVNVGGMGVSGTTLTATKSLGGYNGGGYGVGTTSKYNSGGGGATHIAKTTGILSSLSAYAGNNTSPILIVAGGGGAGFNHNSTKYSTEGGSGGGISGNGPTPGTQTSGGGTFGQGQDSSGGSGGGGGYYGGANCNDSVICSGGSGYIGNTLLSEKGMYCYNCDESTDVSTKTTTTTYYSEIPTSNYAKSGNGYAKISLVE